VFREVPVIEDWDGLLLMEASRPPRLNFNVVLVISMVPEASRRWKRLIQFVDLNELRARTVLSTRPTQTRGEGPPVVFPVRAPEDGAFMKRMSESTNGRHPGPRPVTVGPCFTWPLMYDAKTDAARSSRDGRMVLASNRDRIPLARREHVCCPDGRVPPWMGNGLGSPRPPRPPLRPDLHSTGAQGGGRPTPRRPPPLLYRRRGDNGVPCGVQQDQNGPCGPAVSTPAIASEFQFNRGPLAIVVRLPSFIGVCRRNPRLPTEPTAPFPSTD